VIGIGNRHAGDDAAGLVVAERLRAGELPPCVVVRAVEGDTVAMLAHWEGASAAVLIDAVRSGSAAGTIHRAEASDAKLPALLRRGSSTHAVGVAEAIELARVLGRLPRTLVVYGIEGMRFATGDGLSAAVEAAVPVVAARVLADAARFGGGEG